MNLRQKELPATMFDKPFDLQQAIALLPMLFVLLAICVQPPTAFPAKSWEPIKVIINDWTSQIVLANIASNLFEKVGYRVEPLQVASEGQWYMLKNERGQVQVEVWEGTMADKYEQLHSRKLLVDAGNHDAKTREEWWYPDYVEDLCPGLPDWKALRDCAGIFTTDKTAKFGRYLGGPWEKPDAARIRALDMDFKVVQAKSGDELWVELAKAFKVKQPIVLFNWTPNWVEAKYKGKFIEFPDYALECETEPSWGTNKKFLWDCGNPKAGWLKKVVSAKFPTKYPCAFKIMQNFNFTNAMISEVAALVDVEKMSYENAASKWLVDNELLWKVWLPEQCNK
jgi:glycine betaine/proline transport system substrate-binding protein